MRTMYDALNAKNIPAGATMVAGYIDKITLEPWSAADWTRFPNAVKVQIVKKATTNAGHVGDCETGDMTPAEAVQWVRTRRAAGAGPTIYCNASTWPAVQAAFNAAREPHPHYWIAKYDGIANLPTLNGITAVAKQYLGDQPPGFDKSCVADHWPGVDPEEDDMTPEQDNRLKWLERGVRSIENQLTGNAKGDPVLELDGTPVKLDDWGWPSLLDGTRLSVVDFVRYIDATTHKTEDRMAALEDKLDRVLAALQPKKQA